MSYIQFLGAAGTVTGSKHLIHIGNQSNGSGTDFQLLVDCGLFQGQKEWRLKNWTDLPVPAREIHAVILTHAHLDHCGWIPRLYKEGFQGPIYATPATVDLCGIILPDSGYLQEEDAAFHNKRKSSKHTPALPLYTMEEAQQSSRPLPCRALGRTVQLAPELSFRFVRAAHILGSAMAEITLSTNGSRRQLLFTGDIGRVRNSTIAPGKVVHSGPTEGESPDVLVMESTYGNRHHPQQDVMPELAELINAASSARRQHRGSSLCRGAHPEVSLPAQGADGAEADSAHPRLCRLAHGNSCGADLSQAQRGVQRRRPSELIARHGSPLKWPGFHFARTTEESKKINESHYPSIIVSSNGMCRADAFSTT